MAKVNQLDVCSRCKTELPDPHPTYCPNPVCRARIGDPENEVFGTPQYLWYQYEDALESVQTSSEITVEGEKTLSKDDVINKKTTALKMDLVKWLKECPPEDVIACAEDMFMHAQHIMRSSLSQKQQLKFIALCSAIHCLTEAAGKFLAAGGYTDGRYIIEAPNGNGIGDQEETEESGGVRD